MTRGEILFRSFGGTGEVSPEHRINGARPHWQALSANPALPLGVDPNRGDEYVYVAVTQDPTLFPDAEFDQITVKEYRWLHYRRTGEWLPNVKTDGIISGGAMVFEPWPMVVIQHAPNRDGDRGLVLAPNIWQGSDGNLLHRPTLNDDELRAHLTLWDRLDWPVVGNFPVTEPTPDAQLLRDADVLYVSQVNFMGNGAKKSDLIRLGELVFDVREGQEAGRWSLASSMERNLSNATALPSAGIKAEGRALLVRLNAAIPVPTAEVPIHEILEFKDRRKAELLALRAHMDTIYEAILNSPDRPLAQQRELAKFEKAVADHLKVSRESFASLRALFPRFKVTWDGIKLGDVGIGGLAAFVAAPALNSVTTGLGIGVVSLFRNVKISTERKDSSPFEYLTCISRELIPR
jgi:hypothetical protein